MGRRSRRALLLAMSGVRVKNEELARMGLTLPGFVERSEVIASLPRLGLLAIAAHTPEGWEVEYRSRCSHMSRWVRSWSCTGRSS
jgi:hypothetical protein